MKPGPYSPTSGPLTMHYYHVDSAEDEIYQQLFNLLGLSMGGAWMSVNPRGSDFSRPPAVPELYGRTVPAELPADSADSHQPVELPEN